MFEIISYKKDYHQEVKKFIYEILEKEFNLPHLENLLIDLDNIENIYQEDKGDFWIVLQNNKVVGSIGFRDFKNGKGYIKRMYIDKLLRRQGIGKKLLDIVLEHAKRNKFHSIFVGTKETMREANTFYAKNNFQKVKNFPENIPTFGDPMLYILEL